MTIIPEPESSKLPRYLYKYRSISDNSRDYTRDMLVKNELFFSDPEKFNDPFDSCSYTTRFTMSTKQRDELETIKKTVQDVIDSDGIQKLCEMAQELRDRVIRKYAVCCFSQERDNILLWSHYANCHTGICIQIDTAALSADNQQVIHQVIYQYNYPLIDYGDMSDAQFPFELVKSKHWEYEQEWRALYNSKGTYSIPPEAISGVILGCKISWLDEFTVRRWLTRRHSPVRVYLAKKKEREYGLDIIEE